MLSVRTVYVLSSPHLVANLLSFHTLVTMTKALQQLLEEGHTVDMEALSTLSSYRTEHINRFGNYVINPDRMPEGEHFKPGARKSRGVVHLIGWPPQWNTILSPKLTVSTSGFGGFTRRSGGAFSYD